MQRDGESPQYVTVPLGRSVQTLDNQVIGTIAELRGAYFKIQTPRFHRDFWLRTDSVRSAAPDHPVTLNVSKAQLDNIKIVDEPRA